MRSPDADSALLVSRTEPARHAPVRVFDQEDLGLGQEQPVPDDARRRAPDKSNARVIPRT